MSEIGKLTEENFEGDYCGLLQNLSTLWLSGDHRKGKKRIPTVHLMPVELARRYKLHEPCRILLEGKPDLGGILIRYFGPKEKEDE
jgi:hypothetical protein